jgi:hypothetical protein
MADQNKRMDELESRLAAMADEFRISKAQLETDKVFISSTIIYF